MPAVLVVDDDRAVQAMLADLLTQHGYETGTCSDGREVLTELRRSHYDLVLLDVLLPHVNGFSLVSEIRADPVLRDLPVVMMSGIYRSRNHRSEMMQRFGVVDYLDKPIAIDRLLDLVGRVAGRARGAKPPAIKRRDSGEARLLAAATEGEREQIEKDAGQLLEPGTGLVQGTLAAVPVATVLGHLWHERASGALLLRRDKLKKIVYVRVGSAYHVKSNLVSECLGQILLRERLITAEQLEASIRRMREHATKQGEALVEMKALTARNLAFALELQVETRLFEIFTWREGEYRFNASVEPPVVEVELPWRGAAVVSEGIRRGFDETQLRELLLPVFDKPLVLRERSPDFSDLGLHSEEIEAARAITGGRTTRDVIGRSPAPPPDTLRVIYTLMALEILSPAA